MKPIKPEVTAARDKIVDSALNRAEVNAVGVGFRRVRGVVTDEICVRVMVTRKRPESYLSPSAILPRSVEARGKTVRVDVEQAGPYFSMAVLTLADEIAGGVSATSYDEDIYTGKYRPAPSGVSLGHISITAGTLGCLVTDHSDGSQQILSNNHVLANSNDASIGDAILQPGPIDGGQVPADVIANLKRFVPLDFNGSYNRVDAAIATPAGPGVVVNSSINPNVDPVSGSHQAVGLLFAGDCSGGMLACRASSIVSELDITLPGGTVEPTLGMVVEKVGRTTGWTIRQVSDLGLTAKVGYGGGSIAQFVELFAVPSFSQGGDSGSIILCSAEQP